MPLLRGVMYRIAMSLRDIVYCYVSETIAAPKSIAVLRQSFTENGFSEKVLSENKWLYKRGAPFALEFDYGSEAIEVQVILERLGDNLIISVGNWGFPFEPLLMKRRFRRQLQTIVEQVNFEGALKHEPQKAKEIRDLSKRKSNAAKIALLLVVTGAVIVNLMINT